MRFEDGRSPCACMFALVCKQSITLDEKDWATYEPKLWKELQLPPINANSSAKICEKALTRSARISVTPENPPARRPAAGEKLQASEEAM